MSMQEIEAILALLEQEQEDQEIHEALVEAGLL